jgi:WD40 repeat protein
MRNSIAFRLAPCAALLMAAAVLAVDAPAQGPAAPPQADKPLDLSFVPGKPRIKPMIIGEETVACVRLEFLDQGKILESRRDCRYILKPATLPQPGGAVFFQPYASYTYSQRRMLWDAHEGKALQQHDEVNGPPNQHLLANQNLEWHRDAAGFDLRQICRSSEVEFFLRYKAFQPREPRKVVILDRKTNKELRVVGPLQANAASTFNVTADLEFTKDGTVMLEWNFVNAGRALDLRFWDLNTGQPKKPWQVSVQTAWKVPDRPVTKGPNWEAEDALPRIAVWNKWQCQKPLYLSPDGKMLAVRDKANQIALWDTTVQKLIRNFDGYVLRGFSPDGKHLLAIRDDKDQPGICLLDCQSGTETRVCDAVHISHPESGLLALSANNARLAAYAPAKTEFAYENYKWVAKPVKAVVRVWDTATGKEVHAYTGHELGICSLVISPHGRTVASSDWHGDIHVWELPEQPSASQNASQVNEPRSSMLTGPEAGANGVQNDQKAATAVNAETEKSAAAKLEIVRLYVKTDKDKAIQKLDELIAKYPMTKAADEARRLLKDWRK